MSEPAVNGTVPVWYSSRRGFRLGVLGLPDDKGDLSVRGATWSFRGRRISFDLDCPARVSLVREPPGWAAFTGAAAMVVALALVGVPTVSLLIAVAITQLLFFGHSAVARWVLIEQIDADGSVRKAYLTPAGFGRYTNAARRLCERLQGDVPSPVKPM